MFAGILRPIVRLSCRQGAERSFRPDFLVPGKLRDWLLDVPKYGMKILLALLLGEALNGPVP